MVKITDWLTQLFPVWSVVVAMIALFYPPAFLWYGAGAISWGLGLIMLGMGMTLTPEDFKRVWQVPKLIALGVGLQFLIMPGWSALLATLLHLPNEMAVGLILVACCPGGTASNVVVFLAKGNVALSVSLTLCSTLIAVFMTPWLTYFYAGQYIPIDPWALLSTIFTVVVVPLFVGVIWKFYFGRSAHLISSFSPLVSVVFILLIVGFVLANKRDLIIEHGWVLLIATVLLHLGGFVGGYLGGYLLGRKKIERQTLSIEVGMQNSGLGTALAAKHFPLLSMTPAPCALSAIVHCVVGSLLASKWGKENEKKDSLR